MILAALGHSYDEIGAMIGASYTIVNKLLVKARARIRELRAGGEV